MAGGIPTCCFEMQPLFLETRWVLPRREYAWFDFRLESAGFFFWPALCGLLDIADFADLTAGSRLAFFAARGSLSLSKVRSMVGTDLSAEAARPGS